MSNTYNPDLLDGYLRIVYRVGPDEGCFGNDDREAMARLLAIVAPAQAVAPSMTAAALDVLAERRRQVSAEGWTPAHDDDHEGGQLSRAAACYAERACAHDNLSVAEQSRLQVPTNWPWAAAWWKPKERRRDLVRAGALILAEIERLDRAALKAQGEGR